MDTKNIKIRKGKNSDVDEIARLIYYTEVNTGDVWGGETKEETLENLKILIRTKESRYSTDYITVAELDNKVVGAIILIPYDKLDKLSIETDIKLINRIEGFSEKILYIVNSIKYMIFRECRRGNLYISNIATDERTRGLGVGKLLMMYAEQVAKNAEFEGISLLAKNEKVTKFYEKLNYNKDDVQNTIKQYIENQENNSKSLKNLGYGNINIVEYRGYG